MEDEKRRLLDVRKMLKKRKPEFLRQEYFKHARLGEKWRRPRGRKSWLRREKKGRGSLPSPGYSSPRKVRGLNREGYREVVVRNLKDLEKIDPEKEVAVIASGVGKKKRLMMEEMAMRKKIRVSNSKWV